MPEPVRPMTTAAPGPRGSRRLRVVTLAASLLGSVMASACSATLPRRHGDRTPSRSGTRHPRRPARAYLRDSSLVPRR